MRGREHTAGCTCFQLLLERLTFPDPHGPLCPPPLPSHHFHTWLTFTWRDFLHAFFSKATLKSKIQSDASLPGAAMLQELTYCWYCFGNEETVLGASLGYKLLAHFKDLPQSGHHPWPSPCVCKTHTQSVASLLGVIGTTFLSPSHSSLKGPNLILSPGSLGPSSLQDYSFLMLISYIEGLQGAHLAYS